LTGKGSYVELPTGLPEMRKKADEAAFEIEDIKQVNKLQLSLFLVIPPERSEGGGRNSYSVRGKMGDVLCSSVTSISSYTIGPRRLKFDRNNSHSNGLNLWF